MSTLTLIITLIAGFAALIFHAKARNSLSLTENQEATKQLNAVDTSIAKNEGLLQAEEQTRQHNEVSDVSTQDLVDFVNKRNNPPSA